LSTSQFRCVHKCVSLDTRVVYVGVHMTVLKRVFARLRRRMCALSGWC